MVPALLCNAGLISMQLDRSFWQGCGGYWQPLFIREHGLTLGYQAWQGYQIEGRGLVAGLIRQPVAPVDWAWEGVSHTLRFVPAAQVMAYGQSLELDAEVGAQLLKAVQTYRPGQDMVLALVQGAEVYISLLRNLAIAPPEAHRQVCDRWEEFFPAIVPGGSRPHR
jgi:hypothetical protein